MRSRSIHAIKDSIGTALPYLATRYNENIITALNRLGRIAQSDKRRTCETAARAFEEARGAPQGKAATAPKQEKQGIFAFLTIWLRNLLAVPRSFGGRCWHR